LPVTDFDAGVGADRGEGLQHTVFADARDEPRVQVSGVADILADLRDCREAVRDVRGEPPWIRGERLLNVCSARSNGLREDFG
jgi:hypothetical protein